MSGPLILPYQGRLPVIADDAFIAPNATVIGDVEIGARASIWFGCVLRGDVDKIRVGEGTNVQDGTIVHVSSRPDGHTHIGRNITIGHMSLIHSCVLEDGCFIGMKACLMDEVIVETGAWVAAGALVTPGKRVPKGQVWAGSPARYLRDVTEQEARYILKSPQQYALLAQQYR